MTLRQVLARLGQGVLVVWGAFTLAFLVLNVMPGDPVELMLSKGGEASYLDPAQVAQVKHQFGYDKPLWQQYFDQLGHLATGDLGKSVQTGGPVSSILTAAIPTTLQLALAALLLGVIGGVAVAVLASLAPRGLARSLLISMPAVGSAVPTFWTALMLIQLFSFRVALFPAFGTDGLSSLVLPAVALAVPVAATTGQILIRSMDETRRLGFVDTARAKGASNLRVQVRHVLRNATLPALTAVGVVAGHLIAGAVIIESIFGRNGVGLVATNAVQAKDLPVVQGEVVFAALVFVVINLLVDFAYPLLDPSLRRHSGARKAVAAT